MRSPSGATRETTTPVRSPRWAAHLDAQSVEPATQDLPCVVVGPHRHDACLRSERRRPRRDVRGLPARRERRLRDRVVTGGELRVEPDDHVEEQISERADEHRTIVSWTARTGGANASAPSCTARSSARRRPSRPPAGAARCASRPARRPRASPRSRTRPATARRSRKKPKQNAVSERRPRRGRAAPARVRP